MNESSAELASNVSEIESLKLATTPSLLVAPPRLAQAKIAMECELTQIVEIGDGSAGSGSIVIGRVLMMHFQDGLLKEGKVDLTALRPISRLGGPFYAPVREPFQMKRPK